MKSKIMMPRILRNEARNAENQRLHHINEVADSAVGNNFRSFPHFFLRLA